MTDEPNDLQLYRDLLDEQTKVDPSRDQLIEKLRTRIAFLKSALSDCLDKLEAQKT